MLVIKQQHHSKTPEALVFLTVFLLCLYDMCCFKLSFRLNNLSHSSHLNSLSPVIKHDISLKQNTRSNELQRACRQADLQPRPCDRMCRFRLLLFWKTLLHSEQRYTLLCSRSLSLFMTASPSGPLSRLSSAVVTSWDLSASSFISANIRN